MKLPKLSPNQSEVLEKMVEGQWYSAYNLQCSLATLSALQRMGLVTSRHGAGSFSLPRTGIKYHITRFVKDYRRENKRTP